MPELYRELTNSDSDLRRQVLNLWCWTHETTHTFMLDSVERMIYGLLAAERVAWVSGATNPELALAQVTDPIECPLEALKWADDPELYAMFVREGVGKREASDA